jgi:uncharacterized protein (TIGR00725 family)
MHVTYTSILFAVSGRSVLTALDRDTRHLLSTDLANGDPALASVPTNGDRSVLQAFLQQSGRGLPRLLFVSLVKGRRGRSFGGRPMVWEDWRRVRFRSPDEQDLWQRAKRALPALSGRKPVCVVVGCNARSARFTPQVRERAFRIGALAAEVGFTVLTGGLGGVMASACEGARSIDGETIGILPGSAKKDANAFVQAVLPSGIGYARNYLTVLAADVVVALNGGRGTLEEICFALDFGRPVFSWDSWDVDGVRKVTSQAQVAKALEDAIHDLLVGRPFPPHPDRPNAARARRVRPRRMSP